MAPSFEAKRPLTRSQYVRRRDQTTKEELDKLKSTPEFKKFAKAKGILHAESSLNTKQLTLPAIIAVFITILFTANLPGKVSPNENLEFVQPTAVATARLEQQTEQQYVEAQQNNVVDIDLEYSVIELTSSLKSTEIELYAAQRENKDLLKALEQERNQSVEPNNNCPITPPTIPAAAATTIADNLKWIILGFMGLVTSVIVSVVITNRRNINKTTTLRSENLNLVSQLKELAFEKDMAEQSISILESELQRKMNQLADAQSQYKKPATPVHVSTGAENETGSPRIRAVQSQKAAASSPPMSLLGTNNNTNGNSSPLSGNGLLLQQQQPHQRTPDSLPPPPRQLVERFLEERGAIAIEQEQVQAWLEMESLFGQLQREVTRLRAIEKGREGDIEEQKKTIEELNQALEEQKEAAKMAKAALKAVRSVGTGN